VTKEISSDQYDTVIKLSEKFPELKIVTKDYMKNDKISIRGCIPTAYPRWGKRLFP